MEGFSAFAVATLLVWSNRYATAGVRKIRQAFGGNIFFLQQDGCF
jgi:hypothetical protein